MKKINIKRQQDMKALVIILACVLVYAVVLFMALALAGANGKDEDEL